MAISLKVLQDTISKAKSELKADIRKDIEITIKQELELANKDLLSALSIKIDEIDKRVSTLETTLTGVQHTASLSYDTSDANLQTIKSLATRVAYLETTSLSISKQLDEAIAREKASKIAVQNLERSVDDQINRNMRGNLIFSGLKELEGNNFTSKDIIVNFIHDTLYDEEDTDITKASIASTIVRAHRGKFDKAKPNKVRPIFVKFSRDDYASTFLKQSILKKVTKDGFKVRPQHSAALQGRINLALIMRKKLLDEGKILKGFVEYPATLKGVLSSAESKKDYSIIQTF